MSELSDIIVELRQHADFWEDRCPGLTAFRGWADRLDATRKAIREKMLDAMHHLEGGLNRKAFDELESIFPLVRGPEDEPCKN